MEKAMYIIWVPDGSCVGPDMQKRGCRTELEYPRGLIWISISTAWRADTFRRGAFTPWGPPGRGLSACLPRTSSGKRRKGLPSCAATEWGEIKKKRERARAVCPIKNRARLPDAEIPGCYESARTHLIRVALNVKSGTPRVFPPYYPVG